MNVDNARKPTSSNNLHTKWWHKAKVRDIRGVKEGYGSLSKKCIGGIYVP